MMKIALYCFALVFGMIESAHAAANFVCATVGEWPPMEYHGEKGRLTGYTLDFLETAGRAAGFTVEFIEVDESKIRTGLLEGKYDGICSSMINESLRNETEQLAFSTPYYLVRQALVVNARKKMFTSEYAEGKVFAARKGSSGMEISGNSLPVKGYDSIAEAMEGVFTGALDGVFCDEPVAFYYAKITYRDRLKVSAYIAHSEKKPVAIAVKKENTELLHLINRGIETVKARGQDRELQRKWFVR